MLRLIGTTVLVILLLSTAGRAQDLRLGYRTEPTSLDPHYHNATPSIQVAMHVFDSLVTQTGTDRLDPGLAVSWEPIDPTTWEFKLRPNVHFTDGTPFTAADVVFTFQRVRTVPTPMGGFVNYLGPVAGVEAVDDTTLRVHTVAPTPLLPNYMSRIFILSRQIHAHAATEDFNSGKAMIGTGPYRLTSMSGIDNLTFERKNDYWGKAPIWEHVTSRVISNDEARLAALLAGDVDVIETVPTQDAARLLKDPRVTVSSTVSQRVMYFWFDWLNPGPSANYSDNDGHPLARNPFLDIRVRQAFSKAIDRHALIERLMDGFAVPAGQFVREGQFGYTPTIKPDAYDPEAARRLLAAAGFPHGFRLTIHGPADRWNNDGRVVATVAQMLTRVGVTVQADVLPFSVYVPRESKGDFSFHLSGAGSWTGEVGAALVDTVLTQDRARGWGAVNRGRYSNPSLDALVAQAVHTLDAPTREAMLIRASETVDHELPLVMLYQEMNIWAARKGLKYIARNDERTLAINTVIDTK
ncbi:MAG TPA: ABC transporter substrate-binding protein [Acetobacteraceae bacterium]|jgi:peptide/nickel transport system substrate-binding protein